MTMLNEKLISGYSTFTSTDELMESTATTPAITPTWSVSIIASTSFASGFSVAWTVDAGC